MLKTVRVLGALGLATGALLLVAAPAGGHVSPDKDEVPNEAYEDVTLSVGHGCAEEEDEEAPASPTTAVEVNIPDGLTNVKPEPKAGWSVEIVEEELDEPLEGPYGEPITEQVTQLIWTADEGNELPDEYRDTFTFGFRTTFTEPGDYLFFKVIQPCEEGEHRWIEEYVEGVTEGEEPEEPAPVLLVTEAEEEGAELAAATEEGESSDDDDNVATTLAAVALILGALGLIAGGLALARTRGAASAGSSSS